MAGFSISDAEPLGSATEVRQQVWVELAQEYMDSSVTNFHYNINYLINKKLTANLKYCHCLNFSIFTVNPKIRFGTAITLIINISPCFS